MAVDLLAVNHNVLPKLTRFLETLNSDYEDGVWNLYVADNGSTDGSVEFLKDNQDKYRIKQLVLNKNIGYSLACNDLSARSSSEFLCLLNTDTWFTTAQVKAVEESFELSPHVGVIGPKQMDENKVIRHGGIFDTGNSNMAHRGWSKTDPSDVMLKDRLECQTVSGSIYFVRRKVWDEMTRCPVFQEMFPGCPGAFLPTPHFFEETFFSRHAAHHGYKIVYDGRMPAFGHSWRASNPTDNERLVRLFNVSRDIYIKACAKHNIRNEFTR